MLIHFAAVLLALAIYFPIFGRIVPAIAALPTNLLNYGAILALTAAGFGFLGGRWNVRGRLQLNGAVVGFLGFLFFSHVSKLISSATFATEVLQQFRSGVAGLIYGGVVLFIFVCFKQREDGEKFTRTFVWVIGTFLIIQGALSVLESYRGELFQDYSSESYLDLERRDILSAMGYDRLGVLGLRFAFTGLMGQHNRFGGMLIFLNMLFLLQLVRTRNPLYVLLSALCFSLSLGNTTKTSILAIALSGAIVVPAVYVRARWLRPTLGAIAGITLILLFWERLNAAVVVTGGTMSMLSRVDFWVFMGDRFVEAVSESGWVLLWGMDYESLRAASFDYSGVFNRSFESDFVAIAATHGALGVGAASIVVVGAVRRAIRSAGVQRALLLAFVVSMLISAATLDFNLRYQNLPFLLLIWLVATDPATNIPGLPPPPPNLRGRPRNSGFST